MKSILMVHGITDTGKVFKTMTSYLEKKGYKTHAMDLIPNIGTGDLTENDIAEKLWLKEVKF